MTCPYCAEEIRDEAVKCRHCGSFVPRTARQWYRSREHRIVAGVCGGLAEEFGLPVPLLRLAFVIGAFFGGWGILIYLVLWVILPKRPRAEPPGEAARRPRREPERSPEPGA